MATISEDYVSFEIAKLLKEKGFDVPCLACWYIGSEEHEKFGDSPFNYNYNEVKNGFDWLSRPTLQMAMKWLREVHNTFINITYEHDCVFIASVKNPLKGFDCWVGNKHNCWFKYEEAAEEAILYCLNNLI